MAFLAIEKSRFCPDTVENRTAVAVYGKTARLGVSGDIYKKLGSPAYFKLMLGTGPDAGLVALIPRNMPSPSAYKVGTINKSSYDINVSPKKIGVPVEPMSVTPVPFEITEDGLVADLRSIRQQKFAVAAE